MTTRARESWDTEAHRERYRKLLTREMTLEDAMREETDEWRKRMHALENIINLPDLAKQQAWYRATMVESGPESSG